MFADKEHIVNPCRKSTRGGLTPVNWDKGTLFPTLHKYFIKFTHTQQTKKFTFSLERVRLFAYDNNRDLGKNGMYNAKQDFWGQFIQYYSAHNYAT